MAKRVCRKNLRKLVIGLVLVYLTVSLIEYNYLTENNEMKIFTSNKKCLVIKPSVVQFRVLLDGKIYPHRVPLYENKSIDLNCLNENIKTIKTILMWNKFIGRPITNEYEFGQETPFQQMKCPVTSCQLTNDTSKLNESSLVLFHLRNRIDRFPSHRPFNQR